MGHKDHLKFVEASVSIGLPRRSVFVRQERRQKYVGTTYDKCFIDDHELDDSGISFWELYPRGWLQPDNTTGSTMSLFDGLVRGLGYQTLDGSKFFVVFKLVKNHLTVNVEVLDREESAEEILYSFNRLHNAFLSMPRIWKNEPDRLSRVLPTGKLSVAI